MASDRIFFGSLERQERNRMVDENREETASIASKTTQATKTNIPQSSIQNNRNDNLEIIPFSEESLEAKKRHEEMMKKYDLQKAARNIMIPTNEIEVKYNLRELKQPICFFGEEAGDRRERLKNLMAKILLETGSLPTFKKPGNSLGDFPVSKDEENEYFWYEGPKILRDIKYKIASFSLKNSAKRIESSKIKRITIDPLEEEDLIDNEVKRVLDFEISMCQYADTGNITKGNFSPNQQYYATAGASGQCKIWSIPECELKCQLIGHTNRANNINFHPKSTINLSPDSPVNVCTVASDNCVKLWSLNFDLDQQKCISFEKHEDRVNSAIFHPLGNYMFTVSHDKTWKMWDLETQKEIYTQTGHSKPVYTQSIHPDGSLLFTGDFGGTGMIWDLRLGKAILPIVGHVKQLLTSDFSSNGYHLATGSDDNTIRLWDLRRKNCFYVIPAHKSLISEVKFQADSSKFLYSSSYDNTCRFWSVKDWSLAKTLDIKEAKFTSISITNDIEYLSTTTLGRKWILWKKKNQNKVNI